MKYIVVISIFFIQLLVGSTHFNLTQEEKEYLKTKPTVTIGSIDSYTPFSFIKNNQKIGFTQDLIDIISKRTGIKFQKFGGTWPQVYNKFKSGQIDMITEFSYREDRLPFTNYTNPYYEIPIGVFTRKDFENYTGLESLKGKRVGIVKNSYLVDILQKIKNIHLVLIDSTDERFHYLTNNRVDVVLSNAMSLFRVDSLMLQDIKLAGYFKHPEVKSEDLRFGIKKDKQILSSIINKVLDSISYADMTELRNEWILKSNPLTSSIKFTQGEQEWIDQNEIVIGVENAAPYVFFDSKKQSVEGLYGDILQIVLKNTALKVRYVEGTWSELLEAFKEKKIDMLPSTFYQKSRENFGNFTSSFYKVREYIYTKKENNTIRTFDDLIDKKIAVVKNYATIDKIRKKFPDIQIVETDDLSESVKLVQLGKVDALIDYHLVVENFIRENFILGLQSHIQNDLTASSVHFFSNIDKPVLNSILQRGLDSITREEKNTIISSWISIPYIEEKKELNLTLKEQQFLAKHPVVRFRVRPNRPPFEFQKNGIASGIAVDYVKKSAQYMGLDVEFIIDNSDIHDAYEMVNTTQEKFDSILFSVKNKQRAEEFSFGKEFLTYPMMIITNKAGNYIGSLSDLNNKTVVLEKGFLTNKWLSRDYPDIKVINVLDTQKALELVNTDKNIVYVGNLAVANYMSVFGGLENIKVAAPTPYGNVQYSFIAPKKWPELASILSKGFDNIKPIEHTAIQQKWFSLQTIEKTNYSLVWQTGAVGIFIIAWILWWNRKINTEKNKTKIALSKLQKAQFSLEKKTKEQLEQQQMLLNQSKIAAMGEMLANIAHQWRQPLSVISTASTGLLVEKEFHVLEDEKLEKTLNTINEHAQYLSKTIDTFSDYIKSNKKVQKVILHDRILVAINIVEATFKNHYIKLESNLEEAQKIEMELVVGELSEALINILNNAKDALIQNDIKDPWVRVNLHKVHSNAVITIEDNAGGISQDIISKIFEPYFTTKHKSQGTGLGLHMCYKIVTESLHGKIVASNTKEGAKFEIILPLNVQNDHTISYSI